MSFIKVNLAGVNLWIDLEELAIEGNAALCPVDHVLVDGSDLNFGRCFETYTFAHCYANGDVYRFHIKFAEITDLDLGWV